MPVSPEQGGSGILPVNPGTWINIHYNPVKHALVRCPHAWPHSSFAKWVRRGAYAADWMCLCAGRLAKAPDFGHVEDRAGEQRKKVRPGRTLHGLLTLGMTGENGQRWRDI